VPKATLEASSPSVLATLEASSPSVLGLLEKAVMM
jgi:hypothetical protein